MKRLTCILTSFATVLIAYLPAQGAFTGVVRGDQDWLLVVSNSSNNPRESLCTFSTEELTSSSPTPCHLAPLSRTISKAPSRVRRVIIEVDPGSQRVISWRGHYRAHARRDFILG